MCLCHSYPDQNKLYIISCWLDLFYWLLWPFLGWGCCGGRTFKREEEKEENCHQRAGGTGTRASSTSSRVWEKEEEKERQGGGGGIRCGWFYSGHGHHRRGPDPGEQQREEEEKEEKERCWRGRGVSESRLKIIAIGWAAGDADWKIKTTQHFEKRKFTPHVYLLAGRNHCLLYLMLFISYYFFLLKKNAMK